MLKFAPQFVSVSRPQSLVKPVSPEDEEDHKCSEVLKTQEGRRTRSSMSISEKLRQEKEQQEPRVAANRAEAGMRLRVGQESIQAGDRGQDASKGRGDSPGDQHPEPTLEQKAVLRGRLQEQKVVMRGRLQDKEGQGVGTPREEQRKEVGEPQQRVSPELGGCRLREVKILTRQGSRSMEEKTASVVTSSLDQQVSRNGEGTNPWDAGSWVDNGERESPKVPGGKWDMWAFGEGFFRELQTRRWWTVSYHLLSLPCMYYSDHLCQQALADCYHGFTEEVFEALHVQVRQPRFGGFSLKLLPPN